jgi:serine/threonine protein kinase
MSDGIYEYVNDTAIISTIQNTATLELAAKSLYKQALANGSTDNLTVQICRVDSLPDQDIDSLYHSLTDLPFPPELEARSILDGYEISRTLHTSSRSHVYLAIDQATQTKVVIKTSSMDLRGDAAYLERFLLEEWIARRINNAHVLKPNPIERSPSALYVVMEYIEGQTLYQWMLENPNPSLDTVRGIVEQIAKGLQAFHRMEMLHQDLRPQNIMIDTHGTVKIIDFGATRVAGLAETYTPLTDQALLGTAQYSAPEYFVGNTGNSQSDLFSLAAITYEMLTGQLPYGATVARIKSQRDLERLSYTDIRLRQHAFHAWADHAIARALHPIQTL